ncbi:MAG: OmpA family protein [Phaeodactylibacter sp.]|nr:OmpA family protein [Phaeodactylibacter sp.]MCB9291108.1 OmpA family protein [Lewinellaceae bacterium]
MSIRTFLFFILNILPFVLSAQSGQQLFEQQEYEKARAVFEETLREDDGSIEALLGLARLYAEEDYARYNPDTAYSCLREAQRQFRRLSKGQQRRLEKEGLDNSSMRRLKNEIRDKGLLYALEKGESEALLQYMEHYSRLDHDNEKKAMEAYLQARFEELQKEGAYEGLRDLARSKRKDIEEYYPSLEAKLHEAIFTLYFQGRDSTHLESLLNLLADFPEASARLDKPLSEALWKKPFIARAESYLRGLDHSRLPRTIRVVYYYHYITGDWGDLLGFQNRYPLYADSFNIQAAITIARTAPDLSRGFTDERLPVYRHYIELAAPVHKAFTALQQVIANDLRNRDWERAAAIVRRYAPFFGEDDPRITGLLELLKQQEEGLASHPLGDTINSELGEYAPAISADGQRLFFCRNMGHNEDIYASNREEKGWGAPYPIEALNTPGKHEAPLAISADNTTLLMYDGGIVKYTDKQGKGWSPPRNFFSGEHTPEWQGSTTFASNREAVIFAARTMDIIGARNDDNIDLFISMRQPDGGWGRPVNLGTTLNTPFEDRSPFLHPDMRTLYFSSRGHGGLGNLDVFVTTRIGDGWMEWTTPVNLGKEVNTTGRDWGYKISTDGKTAYFSADAPGKREELFRMPVPERFRPRPVSTIRGRILGLDGKPVAAELLLEDLSTGEPAGQIKPDPETGEFFATLPSGRLYSYTVEGPGLYPATNNIDLRDSTSIQEAEQNIEVPTLEEIQEGGITLPLKNLFFDTDKFSIKPESFSELSRLAELVKAYGLQVEVAGHTDHIGGAEYNQQLSRKRAEAVRSFLLNQGVAPEQVSAAGYGLAQPIGDNETEEGRALNRRVEIRFERSEGPPSPRLQTGENE